MPQLTISSLDELRRAEPEIVSRFAGDDLASQLFLLDPVRAAERVGVVLTPEAIRQWEEAIPALTQRDSGGRYDRAAREGLVPGLHVRIRGLVPPPRVGVAAADADLEQSLSDFTTPTQGGMA
jgi:hypothetical protein